MANLTDELSMAKERCLNQFGAAKAKSLTESVELNLGSTHDAPSESDVAPVLLQRRTYSIRFVTLKVRRLNQALIEGVRSIGGPLNRGFTHV